MNILKNEIGETNLVLSATYNGVMTKLVCVSTFLLFKQHILPLQPRPR